LRGYNDIYLCKLLIYVYGTRWMRGCPNCGKKTIRQATEKEELAYYRTRAEFSTETRRYVLVETIYGPAGWYIDEEDKTTIKSIVEVDCGIHQDVQDIVLQVIRVDKNYPPYRGRIKLIGEIIELK